MKKTLKIAALGITGLLTTQASADKLGLNLQLADETARLGFFSESMGVNELYRYDAGFQFDNDKSYLVDASVLYANKGMLDPNIDLGVKAKLAYVDHDPSGDSTLGILMGVQAKYWLPTPVPSSLMLEYLYGPKILTTGDGDSLREGNVRYQVQLLRNLSGYVGYRQFNVHKSGGGYYNFDKGANIGIEFSF
ncbi:hypothetical protein JX580_10585 [Thiomicrospira microaerophila]|uniref:YfaZ family outer membrane protein n=1 Tax=Thiomicrospira microaerophila TaxID=406020 RepID=UPI00200D0ADD|nr:YfaZ family outer membrane protein [Thiomicrospira microaerophila]UQB42090.1 hypothetical protein JX580_10585 [Thiomicrospira microaerophila]